jgi:hypothetical protein
MATDRVFVDKMQGIRRGDMIKLDSRCKYNFKINANNYSIKGLG